MGDEEQRHGRWWEVGPVFSTTDRGSKITTIAPGREIGRFTPGLIVAGAFTALVWTGLAFLAYPMMLGSGITAPRVESASGDWWWIALTIAAVILMLLATLGLYGGVEERFGQQSAGLALCVAAAGFGFLAAGVVHLRMLSAANDALAPDTPSFERPDGTVLLLFAGIGLVTFFLAAVCVPFVFFGARRRQKAVLELRESAHRYPGEVAETDFGNQWISGRPQFKVTIRYETPHLRGTFDAAMTTRSDRVPLPGFPVRVSVGEDGRTLVEPDPTRPGAFDPDDDRYREPSGGGGG